LNLKRWAAAQDVSFDTARRWHLAGKLPVSACQAGRLIVIGEPVCPDAATGVGSALNGRRRRFSALLRDPKVPTMAGHRDRFARFGAGYVQAALYGRRAAANRTARAVSVLAGDSS
jgi:predicted site-specific integrase-resolvase